jgi:hypothetical protein
VQLEAGQRGESLAVLRGALLAEDILRGVMMI